MPSTRPFSHPPCRRQWQTLEDYINVHFGYLAAFAHFLVEDGLGYPQTVRDQAGRICVLWRGTLKFGCGLHLHVRKKQETRRFRNRLQVRTVECVYAAWQALPDGTQRSLFCYDNTHQWPGHQDAYHLHRSDEEGRAVGPPEWVGRDRWPFLSQVIKELHAWWVQRCVEEF